MHTYTRLAPLGLALVTAGCLELAGANPFERQVDKTFQVRPGSLVEVDITGGAVRIRTGEAGVVQATMRPSIFADSERDANDIVSNYDIALTQTDGNVLVRARPKDGTMRWRRRGGHSFSTSLEVPANVRVRARTSGGSIEVSGERTATLDAHTSGGSVDVEGGAGDLTLRTSGGSIAVDRALGSLLANTSGGNIRVGYVGPASRGVDLDTSGGNIQATLDRTSRFDLSANTSGGNVTVDDLDLQTATRERTRLSGWVNGGGARFRAHTSGGNIRLQGVAVTPDR